MKAQRKSCYQCIFLIFLLLLSGSLLIAQQPQDDEESIRRLWNTGFQKQRPIGDKTLSKITYRRHSPKLKATNDIAENSLVGVTIWNLRSPQKGDDSQARIFTKKKKEVEPVEALVPERFEMEKVLPVGTKARFSIETPRKGFLYIIDREQYVDGTYSEPHVLFPSIDNGKENAVSAGQQIEFPSQKDDPPYIELTTLERPKQHVGEAITLLIVLKPLGLSEKEGELYLNNELFLEWEKKWMRDYETIELINGNGKTWTQAEKAAGIDSKRRLNQSDPMPQTIYHTACKVDEPIMVTFPIKIVQETKEPKKITN